DEDWNETYQYELIGNNLAEISIDESTGNITLNRTNRTETTTYTLNVRITSKSDGHHEDVSVILNIKFAKDPVVSDIDTIYIDETKAAETTTDDITNNITKPDDNAERNGTDWYEIGDLSFENYKISDNITIPDEFDIDITEIALAAARFNGNEFTFNSGTNFNFLPAESRLTLTYKFTVSDTKFDVKTTQTITVIIKGENTKPEWKDNVTEKLGECNATDDFDESDLSKTLEISIADFVNDVDQGDSISLASINGTEIVADDWVEIKDDDNNSLGKFYYDSDPKILHYCATGDYLATFRHETENNLTFNFIVQDDSGCLSNAKPFTITVIGTNKPPVAKEIQPYILTQTFQPLEINIDEIATDMNIGDELNIYSIGDLILNSDDEEKTLGIKDAIKIQVCKQNKTMTITILDESVWSLLKSLGLEIVVADNSGAENSRSEKILVTIMLSNQSS
ncbi:MAG: hypothetical protein LBL62_07550, partial [Planctomycetaceae bacterium]|nr:hypothetical protein [Planctomycetaceae bacterium]